MLLLEHLIGYRERQAEVAHGKITVPSEAEAFEKWRPKMQAEALNPASVLAVTGKKTIKVVIASLDANP